MAESDNVLPAGAVNDLADQRSADAVLLCQRFPRKRRRADQTNIGLGQFCRPRAMNILSRGHAFKMGWIHAHSDRAEVVDLHTLRDWPDLLFVHRSMGKPHLVPELDSAVSARPPRSTKPYPAGRCEAAIFNSPQLARQTRPRMLVMLPDEPDRFSPLVSKLCAGPSRGIGSLAASTLAEAARVRGTHYQTIAGGVGSRG